MFYWHHWCLNVMDQVVKHVELSNIKVSEYIITLPHIKYKSRSPGLNHGSIVLRPGWLLIMVQMMIHSTREQKIRHSFAMLDNIIDAGCLGIKRTNTNMSASFALWIQYSLSSDQDDYDDAGNDEADIRMKKEKEWLSSVYWGDFTQSLSCYEHHLSFSLTIEHYPTGPMTTWFSN